MALLLDDLLDVSRINSGRLALKKEAVALDQVLCSAVELVQPLVDAKQLRLDVTQPPASLVLQADGLRLSQVVTNLLNNAAKYTDPGGVIELSSRLDRAGMHIAVKDNGIGIDAALLPTIFAMFSQVEATMDRSQDGLGIGLSLAKKIVNLHGGTIRASSAGRGQGTTVTVVLPASLVATAGTPSGIDEPAVTPTDAGRNLRVMVVDDNVDAAHTFAEVLRFDGHEVVVAHSGKLALQLAAGGLLQVAIPDIGMPVMNGYELAHAIRAEPWGRNRLLVALTDWGMESDRQRAFAAGFDHHFTRPTDPFDICKLLVESGWAKMVPMSRLAHTRNKIYKTVSRQLHGIVPCWVCGEHVVPAAATLEHIMPLSEGGNSHAENLAISHEVCNNQRHARGRVDASPALADRMKRRTDGAAEVC